jgi:hypothetical protein
MQAAIRPWLTTGVAIIGASVIAVAPVAPPPPPAPVSHTQAPSVHAWAVDLNASIVDIFTLPVLRQWAANLVLDYGTYAVAIAEAGANIGRAIGLIPETVRLLGQQLLTGDFQGALTTIETALVGTVAAIGAPLLDAFVTVRQRILARQSELQAAVPAAIIGVGAGVFGAIDGVLRSGITGGQEIVDALLPLDLGHLATTVLAASRNFLGSFVEGGQDIVDGIVFAQQTIAAALATPAPPAEETSDEGVDSFAVDQVPNLDKKNAPAMTLSFKSVAGEQDSLPTTDIDAAEHTEQQDTQTETDDLDSNKLNTNDLDPESEPEDATATSDPDDTTEQAGEDQQSAETGAVPSSEPSANSADEQADAA